MRAISFVCCIEGVACCRLHMVYMHLAGGSWWFHNLMILEEMTRIRFGGIEVVYACLIDEEFVWSACAASPHLLQDKSFRVRESEVGWREVVCREGMDEEMRIWGWGNLRVRDELFPTMSLTVSRSYLLPVCAPHTSNKLSARSSSEPWHFCGYWSLEPATGSYWEQISNVPLCIPHLGSTAIGLYKGS